MYFSDTWYFSPNLQISATIMEILIQTPTFFGGWRGVNVYIFIEMSDIIIRFIFFRSTNLNLSFFKYKFKMQGFLYTPVISIEMAVKQFTCK